MKQKEYIEKQENRKFHSIKEGKIMYPRALKGNICYKLKEYKFLGQVCPN